VTALIARAEAHSPEAGFGERIAENQRRVFQIAYGVLGNSADAEDLARKRSCGLIRSLIRSGSGEISCVGEPDCFSAGFEPPEELPAEAGARYRLADHGNAGCG